VVIVAIALTVIEVHLNLVRYKNNDVFQWDITGYYSYLQATFIDKDVSLSFITPENKKQYDGITYTFVDDQEGYHIFKYSMGMSVMYAPFFLIAHSLAKPLGFAPDGYSAIYQFAVEFSGLFYLIIGLYFIRRLLIQFYSERIAALTIGIIFFATNLLYYSTVEAPMSHAYTFSLLAVLLYFTQQYYQKVKIKYVAALGVVMGLIILIRPLNVLFVLPIILYKVYSFFELKQRFLFFIKHYKHVLLFVVLMFLICLPQLLYYKFVTGHYLVFSYGSKERFYFNEPKILDVLFSFRKGWFIYTPIMLFVMYALWRLRKHHLMGFKSSIYILLPIYLFLVSSWWCWWYGGSFSQRSLIDLYPLLLFPLAAILHHLKDVSIFKKRISYTFITICLLLNILQTFQYKYNIIDYDGMTFKEYAHVFGTLDSDNIDTLLLDKPDYEAAVRGQGR